MTFKRILPLFVAVLIMLNGCSSVDEKIEKGQFAMATKQINKKLGSGVLTDLERIALQEKKDIMHRIELDFNKTLDDIIPYIKQYYPDLSSEQIREWEESKALEKLTINGSDRYFARAAQNLFRIDPEAKKKKIAVDGTTPDKLDTFLDRHIPEVLISLKQNNAVTGEAVKFKFTYTLTVDADAVPDGEIIRCWLPFPREGNPRQSNVKLISASEKDYVLASNDNLQRTVYMQKAAEAGKPTVFEIKFSTTARPQWFDLENAEIGPYDKNSEIYKTYTAEKYPHLTFTPTLKAFSEKVVGKETNPYRIVSKIFKYISEHFPWASAREYSTLEHIPDYVIENKHGDCGQVTLLFMALARYNGIPARWQSGWMLHPGSLNLHDWCEIYFEGIGWVPVDQSFGRRNLEGEDAQMFYLGGLDAYRLIVNDDYGMPLFPEKQFLRSETNDFQRGEVEWRGGNLYFNMWDYHMDVEYLTK